MSPEAWEVLKAVKNMRAASPSLAAQELRRAGLLNTELFVTDKGRLFRRRRMREETAA